MTRPEWHSVDISHLEAVAGASSIAAVLKSAPPGIEFPEDHPLLTLKRKLELCFEDQEDRNEAGREVMNWKGS